MVIEMKIKDLAIGFLERAHEDIMAAEYLINNKPELARVIIWHVQQAVEKVMKASLLVIMAEPLRFYGEIGDKCNVPDVFRRLKSDLKKIGNKYMRPKEELGHKVHGHLTKDANKMCGYWVRGELQRYIKYIHDNCLIPSLKRRREELIEVMRRDFGLTYNDAKQAFEMLLNFLRILPEHLTPPANLETKIAAQVSIKSPCIALINRTYEDWVKNKEKLQGEIYSKELFLQNAIFETLKRGAESDKFSEFVTDFFKKIMSTIMLMADVFVLGLPLHACLHNYVESSRFPDAGEIPKEDLDSTSTALTLTRNLYESAKLLLESYDQ